MSNTETPDEHDYGKRDEDPGRDHAMTHAEWEDIEQGRMDDEDKRERTCRIDED